MKIFLAVVVFHFVEHIAQMVQLYALHWLRPECLGILGLWFPWLIHSELLHLAYAVYMLGGLYWFDLKNRYWVCARYLQSFHLTEHVILMAQLLLLLERTGIGGLWFPRIELHFVYNLMVFVPMMMGFAKNNRGVSL